jgi:hypothetical protein
MEYALKRMLAAAAAVAGLAALTGCSASPAVEDDPSAAPSESTVTPAPSSTPVAAGSVKEACELFNSLYARYGAVPGDDPDAYEDIYLKSEDAKNSAPDEVFGLFAALSLIAIDHAGAAETGGEPEQASKDAIRDAVFANAGTCTAADVTLQL